MTDPTNPANAPLPSSPPPLSPEERVSITKPISKSILKGDRVFNDRRQVEPLTPPATPQASGPEFSDKDTLSDPLSRQTTPERDDDDSIATPERGDNGSTATSDDDDNFLEGAGLSLGNQVDPVNQLVELEVQASPCLDTQGSTSHPSTEFTSTKSDISIHDDPPYKTTTTTAAAAAATVIDSGTSGSSSLETTNTVSKSIATALSQAKNETITTVSSTFANEDTASTESPISAATESSISAAVETTTLVDNASATTPAPAPTPVSIPRKNVPAKQEK
ncbi:hypothetical protein BGZ95_003633 [Linnemannia exigua]|uniref:Uncharacterized protein n=1 Tax=Linnemannia exigua TaxID=604196 RepID=A0AAD4H966_9FUNG|nr:hypothetical protein BGZ95_003633 [Linnemannia exigua]